VIRVHVKFFAAARDIAGASEKVMTLPPGSTASAVLAALENSFPRFREWKGHLRIARNLEYVTHDARLNDQDEVAIIPPVSGG
jgi:molybdopterin converting factor subunit 1